MSRILVAGGAGFIGSHLCSYLINNGHKVICLDNLYTGRTKNIDHLKNNPYFEFINHDIIKPLDLTGLDKIFNLACPASPPAYQKDPIYTWKTSTIGTLNLLDLSLKNGKIPFLQASTSEVYGDPNIHPQVENYWGNVNPIGIRSCYDEGKRAAESLCFDYYRQHSVPIKIIRIFNTYGPNMDPKDGRVVSNLICQALSNQPITIYGSGQQTRSFQYVDDLINGMIKMMDNKDCFIGPVNLGNPVEFTIKELSDLVLKLIPNSTSTITYDPCPSDDPKKRKPDITLANKILNWQPHVSLEEGLQKTIPYFQQEINGIH